MTDLVSEAELEAELRALAPRLDRIVAPAPPPRLVERTLLLANAELRRAPALVPGVAAPEARLPAGFRRELARLVAATLPLLALVLAWDWFLLREGSTWLAAWLPAGLAFALVTAYVAGSLGWLALTYASLPLLAYRRTRLRLGSSHA